MQRRIIRVAVGTAVLALAPSAGATFPGRNGDLAFSAHGSGPPGGAAVVWRLDRGTKHIRQLTRPAPSCRWRDDWADSDVQWSPSGRSLAYFHWDTCSGAGSRVGVWIMAADGSRPRPIALLDARDAMPMFSRDGERLAVLWSKFFGDPLDVETQSRRPVLSVLGAHDGGVLRETELPRPLALVAQGADWGPSGRIAFAAYRPRFGQRIETVLPDGRGRSRLTARLLHGPLRGPSIDAEPSWSPDGKALALLRTRDVVL